MCLASPDIAALTCGDSTMHKRRKLLPQELIDMIIDFLGWDYERQALHAFSLVSRACLPRSRRHIHSTVRFDFMTNLENMKALYKSPTLAAYVRSLSIDTCGEDGMPADQSWVDDLELVLKSFPNVERLSIEGIAWSELKADTQGLFYSHYPAVTDIWLATCDFAEPSDLVRLLQAFPKLRSARMEGVSSDDVEWGDILQTNSRILSLHWLDVGDLCTSPDVLAKWASVCRQQVTIENIHFTWQCADPSLLGNVLKLAGPSVKTLSITMDTHAQHAAAILPQSLDLSHNNHLRTLRLLARIERYDNGTSDISWIPDCLSQLSSPDLGVVQMHVEVRSFDQLPRVNWERIDSILANTKSLKTVEVCIIRRWEADAEEDAHALARIMASMGKLKSRGILDVMQQFS